MAKNIQLEYGLMTNVMAALCNIGGANEERKFDNSLLVTFRKVWLTPAARMSCSNVANIGERSTWTQCECCTWQNSVRGKSPQRCICSAAAHEMAKHRAKLG